MYPFIESIRIEDGEPFNLGLHQQRFDATRNRFFPDSAPLSLNSVLEDAELPEKGRHKCRIGYGETAELLDITPYTPRIVRSLRLVEADSVDYAWKYSDRSGLNRLRELRGECDDIVITRKGFITDTSYSHLIFLKEGQWYTPSTFLLPGTMRRFLLDTGQIAEAEIRREMLGEYQRVSLINAMLDPGDVELDCRHIIG